MSTIVLLGHYCLFHSVDFISHLIATNFLVRLKPHISKPSNIFANFCFLMDTVLSKFQTFAFKPE